MQKKSTAGFGDGEKLSEHFCKQSDTFKIKAFKKKIDPKLKETDHEAKLGSEDMFKEIKKKMDSDYEVLIYIHGFNVSWEDAVGSALSLQEMANQRRCLRRCFY